MGAPSIAVASLSFAATAMLVLSTMAVRSAGPAVSSFGTFESFQERLSPLILRASAMKLFSQNAERERAPLSAGATASRIRKLARKLGSFQKLEEEALQSLGFVEASLGGASGATQRRRLRSVETPLPTETETVLAGEAGSINPFGRGEEGFQEEHVTFGEEDGFMGYESLDWSHLVKKITDRMGGEGEAWESVKEGEVAQARRKAVATGWRWLRGGS